MHEDELFIRFGSALAIGLLVGLQREYEKGDSRERLFAGVRTYPLLALSGTTGALLSDSTGSPLPLVAVFAGLSALVLWAYVVHTRTGRVGATTETSALLTILAGALCYYDHIAVAAALAVVMTALLSLKPQMHRFVRGLDRADIYAIVKFALITAVVLPVLPNRTFGPEPLNVLNPYRIWLMVVFVSGISFLGYVLIKLLGARRGMALNGLLGGLVSSTAVSMGLAQRSKAEPQLSRAMGLAIALSWAVANARVVAIVPVVNRELGGMIAWPLLASAAAGLAYSGLLLWLQREDEPVAVTYANPFELGPALTFGLIYAVILVAARAAQLYLGETGLYVSSVAAGVVSQTAISLSLAEIASAAGPVSLQVAAQALILASLGNMVVKGGLALFSGSPGLRRVLWPALVLMVAAAVVAALLVI